MSKGNYIAELPSQEYLMKCFRYENGKLFWKVAKASSIKVGQEVSGQRNRRYLQVTLDGQQYLVHRIIYKMFNGCDPAYIDHINGITKDNRIENLRSGSLSQNNGNLKTPKHNSSGFKGVSWDSTRESWRACIKIFGKTKHIGYFDSPESAKMAYDVAAVKVFGEYARP